MKASFSESSDKGFYVLNPRLEIIKQVDLSGCGKQVSIQYLSFEKDRIMAINRFEPGYIEIDPKSFNIRRTYSFKV